MPYDTFNDFAFVGMMARAPLLAVVHPSPPVKNIKALQSAELRQRYAAEGAEPAAMTREQLR